MREHFDDGRAAAPQISLPRPTPAVRKILWIYAIFFLATFALYLASTQGVWAHVAFHWFGLDAARWHDDFPLVPVWQVVTYGLFHAVDDPWHVLVNALTLYFFGTMLEEILGTRRFVVLYVMSQLAGAVAWLVPAAFGRPLGLAIGASGAVFGVMVAVATLRPRQVVYLFVVPVMLKWLAILMCVATLFSALVQLKSPMGGSAYVVHLGGALYGFLAVRTGLALKDPLEVLERKRAVAAVQREADDAARMDALLDKIHREGMGSLTRSEREFLKRTSSRR